MPPFVLLQPWSAARDGSVCFVLRRYVTVKLPVTAVPTVCARDPESCGGYTYRYGGGSDDDDDDSQADWLVTITDASMLRTTHNTQPYTSS